MHGWAIAERIRQISGEVLRVGQSALYPALHKLEQQGWIKSEWKLSETNRRAKYYSLTRAGRKALADEAENWERLSAAISALVRPFKRSATMSRWLTQIRLAVRSLFRRPQVDQELDEEFQYHLERQIEDNLRRGLAPEEARYAAMREMGPIAKSKEECRDARRVNWMQDLAQDLCYGLRMLRKSPGFTTVAVLTLALGIGVTTAILSIIDPVLFRPLPYANSDRLVSVGFRHAVEAFEFMFGNFYYDWSDHQTVFTEMTAQSAVPRPCDLTDRDPMRLTCSYVHQNFLPTLGIRPVVGSNFTTDDMLPDAPLTVMLSYELWKSRYNITVSGASG